MVLDSSIAISEIPFAIHAGSSSDTVFVSGKDLVSYLKSFETADAKVHEVDFATLKTGVAASASVPAPAPTSSKGENPIQIAIGAKKDEDFSAWYTDVNLPCNCVCDPL